ncbi:MAG: amidohydrolase, partial [Sphingobium limneticum]
MRRILFASLLAATASIGAAEPASKEQLMVPPSGARHYTISSTAGKHGDVWSWKLPDGHTAYRMSMSLRGWVTETDEVMTAGPDGRPTAIAIRGYTDQGDATEDFSVDAGGVARWKTSVDSGSAPFGDKRYNTYGGPWLAGERDIEALVAAGARGIDLLPTGHASIAIGQPVQIDGPQGAATVKLAFIR